MITPLLKQGQSIAHIYSYYKDEIPCCMKSVYYYIDQGLFTVPNIDLLKKVKYRERKKKQESFIDYSYRESRTYKKFQSYIIQEHPEINVVELDVTEISCLSF